eukprot:5355044-Alexandrium_andersonii.AAC.1
MLWECGAFDACRRAVQANPVFSGRNRLPVGFALRGWCPAMSLPLEGGPWYGGSAQSDPGQLGGFLEGVPAALRHAAVLGK